MKKKSLKALLLLLRVLVAILTILFMATDIVVTDNAKGWGAVFYHGFIFFIMALLCAWALIKFNRILYALLILSILIYLGMFNFQPEIILLHDLDGCLDSGNVWDHNEERCRDDCLKWDKEQGCIPN